MRIISYDEALNELCDTFDALIEPRKIRRANTNVIYLLIKAFAKGWEVINSTVYALYGKFIPTLCSDKDLESIGYIVGTRKIGGSYSGLSVTAVNNSPLPVVLARGTYTFSPDADNTFSAVIDSDVEVAGEGAYSFIMMSDKVGSYRYTEMSDIQVTSDTAISDVFTFSCADNSSLLGHEEESDLAFRNRILTDVERQDVISELRDEIRSLPYVFDCNIKFNNTAATAVYDGIEIDPYRMLLMVSGDMRSGIAEAVAKKGIYPTQQTDTSVALTYKDDVFFNGYTVYATPFKTEDFSVTVTYSVDPTYLTEDNAEQAIRSALFAHYTGNQHVDVLTENDVFGVLLAMNLTGLKVLGVSFSMDGKDGLEYLKFSLLRIPTLKTVSCVPVVL